jgi:hypothetical protein
MTPTVTAALVNAVSTLRRVKKPVLTNKTFSINNNAELDFCLLVSQQKIMLNFTNIPRIEKGVRMRICVCYLSKLSIMAN